MKTVYSAALADWAMRSLVVGGGGLILCKDALGVFNGPSRLGSEFFGINKVDLYAVVYGIDKVNSYIFRDEPEIRFRINVCKKWKYFR